MKKTNETSEQEREQEVINAFLIVGGTILLITVIGVLMASYKKTIALTDVMSQLHSL